MRRVKNVGYDADEWGDGDWGGGGGDWGDWDDGGWSKPKPKPKAKTEAKAKPKPKAKEVKEVSKPSEPKKEEETKEVEAPIPAGDGDGVDSTCLVITGHVDAGKSTLMGHLLYKLEHVTQREMHKMEKEATQMGRGDFKFAWVLDEGDDERARGVTIDLCIKHFKTKKGKALTVVDAPGHRDFVPNMVLGATLADVAVLVVDVKDFDAGFARGGQTKEHLQLVRSLGAAQLVVCVNKMDAVDWDESRYNSVRDQLSVYILEELKFNENKVIYVPISGFKGENLLEKKDLSWYDRGSLVDVFDGLDIPTRPKGALRIPITDSYRSGSNMVLSGRVEGTEISVGQKVTILPSNEVVPVKALASRGEGVRRAVPGCYLDNLILPLEPQYVCPGSVVCINPPAMVSEFRARILVFDVSIPMVKGQQYTLHCSCQQEAVTLGAMDPITKGGRKLKCLTKGNSAIVTLKVDRPIVVEASKSSLGRIILREKGQTIAAGIVV